MSLSSDIWERSGRDLVSRRVFIAVMTGLVAFGIATSAVASTFSMSWKLDSMLILVLALGVLVVSIAGVFISVGSENPLVSFAGYLLVTIPFGVLLGPVIAQYTEASVVRILFLTTVVVVGLGLVGAIYPKSLEGWGSWLFGALLLLLFGLIFLAPLARILNIPATEALNWMDWIGVVIFSAYVIYDLNRAMRIPSTMDNAVDSALAVYLDFVNLFIRLLSLFGKKK